MKVKPRYIAIITFSVIGLILIIGGLWGDVLGVLKASGYIPYTIVEVQEMAFTRCIQCHPIDKVTKYCMRCGPPFVVVVHNVKKLIALEKGRPGREYLKGMTDAEAVAITQVWNALVGNWEETWREKDIIKLLEGDDAQINLLKTPVKERKIEVALRGKRAPGTYEEVYGVMKP
ncbi:MAG: hypothetical protein HY878_02975 [Deltaproteobacteria bacterium]|nr:hypothetical protein [Deltaproteobacteria bacterium]